MKIENLWWARSNHRQSQTCPDFCRGSELGRFTPNVLTPDRVRRWKPKSGHGGCHENGIHCFLSLLCIATVLVTCPRAETSSCRHPARRCWPGPRSARCIDRGAPQTGICRREIYFDRRSLCSGQPRTPARVRTGVGPLEGRCDLHWIQSCNICSQACDSEHSHRYGKFYRSGSVRHHPQSRKTRRQYHGDVADRWRSVAEAVGAHQGNFPKGFTRGDFLEQKQHRDGHRSQSNGRGGCPDGHHIARSRSEGCEWDRCSFWSDEQGTSRCVPRLDGCTPSRAPETDSRILGKATSTGDIRK